MFETEEATYYFMQGLDNLEKRDLEDIIKTILSIKENGDKSRYKVAQELYEIVNYHIINYHIINLTYNAEGLKYKGEPVKLNDISMFIGKGGFAREWDRGLEIFNIYLFSYSFKELIEHKDEVDRVQFIKKMYNKYKELTGKELVIPIIMYGDYYHVSKRIEIWVIRERELGNNHMELFEKELQEDREAQEFFINKYRKEYDSQSWDILKKDMSDRVFYKLEDLLELYKEPFIQENLDYYLALLEEGFTYIGDRMKGNI